VGFLVQLIKGTSIASIIGFVELTRAGQLMVNVTFQPMLIYPLVALMYFAICWPISLLSLRLERRLDVGRRLISTPTES
jgi:polar amino acid transport system permease protein